MSWPSLQLPLVLAAVLLVAILLGPILAHHRTHELQTEIAEIYTPARDYMDDVELALVRAMSALRGLVITGDERFIEDFEAARAMEVRSHARLRALAARLDPAQAQALRTMHRAADQWLGRISAHLGAHEGAPPGTGERIPVEEDLYRRALDATVRADAAVRAALQRNWDQIAVLDQRHTMATAVLALLVLFAVLIMGWIGRRVRLLTQRLERRAREEVAFRNVARDLAATAGSGEVSRIAAEGAHALTGSAGVFIERAYAPEQPVEVVALAGRGAPRLHTRVPYPGSLTEQMIATGEPEFYAAVKDITGPMAANLARSCRDCAALVVPLGPKREPLGAMVLLREPGQRPFLPEEIGRIRIVTDFTSLALRRGLLLQETEQRREEAEASEQRYRSLFMYSPDAVLETDPARRLIRANPAAARIFGYPMDELLALDWIRAIVPEDRAHVARTFHAALAGEPQDFSMTFVRKDGRPVEIEGTKLPIVVGGRNIGVFTIGADVTERRRYQRALQETNQRLEAVIDASPIAIIVLDAGGLVRRWNPAARQIFGWTEEEVLGHGLPILHGESIEEFRRYHAQVMRGEAFRGLEIRRLRRDGVLLTLRLSTAPLRDADGRITGLVGLLEDITERKRAEAERRRLLERERSARDDAERRRAEVERLMESKARLIRGFSHDLKNPLGAVAGFAELLESGMKGPLTPEQHEGVSRIRQASQSMLELIEDLLELSRAEAGRLKIEWQRTDARDMVHALAEEHRASVEAAELELRTELPDRLAAIETDPSRVRQILGNLLSNAIKYTPAGGRVTVEAELRTDSAAPRPGRWLAVRVRDNGPGIPPEMHERIFEEFARLAPGAPEGAGLGLAISRRIARLLKGEITLDSTVGVGSTFTLWLPLPPEPPAHAP